jgi:dUTPase
MKNLFTLVVITFFMVTLPIIGSEADPMQLPVNESANSIVVDGVLDDPDWSRNDPYLMYKIGGMPGGKVSTPTGYAIVKPTYLDTSTCYVKLLYRGMDLYISLNSDDQQVCRFGDSWEGDGLFMKIKDATGSDVEIKLYYNLAGVDPDIHYEGPAHSEGAGVKASGTIVNDSTNVDSGYTAELRISLSGLGYTEIPDTLQVLMNIFDPDNYSDGVPASGPNGNFAKQWWGSEWGPDMRYLVLIKNADPASLPVYRANNITVDGNLNESDWSKDIPRLKFNVGGSGMGNVYVPTNFDIVKSPYTDVSSCNVKFIFDDSNLYISLESDDKQVCRFGDSWEGDGLFMKIKDASGSDVEFKLYYNLGGVDPDIHYEGPAHSEGAGVKGNGTIVNDSTNVDSGYTAELRISLTGLGFAELPDSLEILMNIFDPDNYSDGVPPWGPNGNFAKQWWGSEWGPDHRSLVLLKNVDPPSLPVYKTGSSMTIDGALNENEWNEDVPRLKYKIGGMGMGDINAPTGYAIVKPTYLDTSTCYVRFLHDDSNLYISLDSDDQQVCRFGDSWEGDGLFMKIKDATGSDVEIKLYYNLGGVDPDIHYEGPTHSEGAGLKGTNTIVNDSTNVDNGYTAELRISLTGLGYSTLPDSLQLMINIFDPDNYSDGVPPWGPNGNFAKQWWGSEWGPDMRYVILNNTVLSVGNETEFTPKEFILSQNYPNPFNPNTKIEYSLPVKTDVNVEIFNSLGAKVATLVNGQQSAGKHIAEWNGIDASGKQVASGVYFYRVSTTNNSLTKKMVFIK